MTIRVHESLEVSRPRFRDTMEAPSARVKRSDTHRPVFRAETSSQILYSMCQGRLSIDGEQCDVPSWGTDSHGTAFVIDVLIATDGMSSRASS